MSNSTNLFQFQQQKKPQKQPQRPHDNVIESLRNVGSSVGNTVTRDVAGKVASDAFAALLGNLPKPGEQKRPNPFERQFPPLKREIPRPTPEILSPARVKQEQEKIARELEGVRVELSALAKSMGQLNQEIEKTIMEMPVNPGVYHVNFFERLRRVLKSLRQRVDDSKQWMNLTSGRKKQKGYWGAYKKHGTKFGLSSERTVATQTG